MKIIIAVIIVIFIISLFSGDNKKKATKRRNNKVSPVNKEVDTEITMEIEMLGDEQYSKDEYQDRFYSTYIAGTSHHCTIIECNAFVGFAVPEPNNKYDKNAVAILNNKGKLLGYIAKKELKDFREWSNCKTVPCVGYISKEDDGSFHSNLKCIKPYSMDFIKEEITRYLEWYNKNR